MLRSLVTLFFLLISLYASENSEILKRADAQLKSGSKTEVFRAYNDYKNLYLRAMMDDDGQLRLKSLEGIVASGGKLRIDVAKYKSEFATLKKSLKNKPPVTAKKSSSVTKKQSITVTKRHHLKKVRWQEDRLVLAFSKHLRKNQVNYFKLYDKKKKRYRYVFDIKPSLLDKQHTLKHKEIKRIKIAQYNQDTIRLVIENDKKLNIRFKRDKELLVINPGVSAVVSPVADKPVYRGEQKVIVLDPGHGGKDPGSVGYKRYREKIVVMQVANKLKKILKKNGHKVYMTRTNDRFVKLRNRTKYANRKKADIFISIHANAVPKKNVKKAQGVETYFLSNARSERAKRVAAKENSDDIEEMNYYGKQSFLNFLNTEKIIASNKLAIDLQKGMLGELRKSHKVKDGGVRQGPFWVLVGAQMPAVLVEVGFITHPTEAKRIVNSSYQDKLARGMAKGIERYFANSH